MGHLSIVSGAKGTCHMWSFRFAVDYKMIDTRVETHMHTVTFTDRHIKERELAWNHVKDTFPYQDMEYAESITVRLLAAEQTEI